MSAGQILMLTLIFPVMCSLLFAVVQIEKRQFGMGQGSSVSRRTAGDQPSTAVLMERSRAKGRHARALSEARTRHFRSPSLARAVQRIPGMHLCCMVRRWLRPAPGEGPGTRGF
jgi:hypothetical protein